MDTELHVFLETLFKHENHNKYHKYCDLWINNLTATQIFYFNLLKNKMKKKPK